MDNRQSVRVEIDLSKVYSDHRKVAWLLVKKEMKTISDLKHHITEIFGINDFFLLTSGHFLPDLEDIQVVNFNETICVIPINENRLISNEDRPSNGYESLVEKPSKKRNLLLDVIEEQSPHLEKGKKRKKSLENEEGHYQKKKNQKINSVEQNVMFENESSVNKPTDVDKKISKKSVLKSNYHRISESDKVATVTSRTDTNIKCHNDDKTNVTRSCDTRVRLSRHVDTPIKAFKNYVPPKQITKEYLSQNKINIVKIDIIEEKSDNSVPEIVEDSLGLGFRDVDISESKTNSSENYVKKVVEHFEKVISPDKISEGAEKDTNNTEFSQTEASNYTKIYLSQKDANTSFASQPHTDSDTEMVVVEKETSATDLSSQKMPRNDFGTSSTNSSVLSACQTHSDEKIPEQDKYNNCDRQQLNKTGKPVVHNYKRFGGVGHFLEKLKETDCPQNEESDVSVSNNTKRKRVRKRRRVNHKKSDFIDLVNDSDVVPVSNKLQSYIISDTETSNSHVRFEDNDITKSTVSQTDVTDLTHEDGFRTAKTIGNYFASNGKDNNGSASNVFIGGTIVTSTPLMKDDSQISFSSVITAVITDDNEKVVLENKSVFSLDHIQKSPLMTEKLEPKIGDFIAFKILKLSENCTPQPSDYIIGEVIQYLAESETTTFRITRGLEEFSSSPSELFVGESSNEKQQSNIKELVWTRIIEPRLLYP